MVCLVLLLGGCQVRHDHSKQMQQMRVPVDTAQRDYVEDVQAEAAAASGMSDDEGLIVVPCEPVPDEGVANVDEQIERMLKGEEVE